MFLAGVVACLPTYLPMSQLVSGQGGGNRRLSIPFPTLPYLLRYSSSTRRSVLFFPSQYTDEQRREWWISIAPLLPLLRMFYSVPFRKEEIVYPLFRFSFGVLRCRSAVIFKGLREHRLPTLVRLSIGAGRLVVCGREGVFFACGR